MHKQCDVLFIAIFVFACVDVCMYVERKGRKLGLGKASDSQGESVACSYYCGCVYIAIKITLLLLMPSFVNHWLLWLHSCEGEYHQVCSQH